MTFVFQWKPPVISIQRVNRCIRVISSERDSVGLSRAVVAIRGDAVNSAIISSD